MSKPVNGRPALSDEVKKRLKPLIIELRRTLEEDLERELRRLGLDGSKDRPVPVEMLSYLTDQEREIRAELEAILSKEQESIGSFAGALEAVRREAAYTHLNRLVGLKCLELRSHLVIEGERTEAVTCRQEFGGRSKWLWTLRSRESRYRHGAQAEELLWREGLLQACAAVTQEIGVLFDPADPYAKVWPSFRTLRAVVDRLNELPEDAFRTDELLGWVYQYFQTEEKEKVTAGESFTQKLKKTKKITGADIATYTALYTERYMVDFLLQNSIGAYWMEMYPDSRAKEAWQYYVTPATPHTRLPKPLKEWKLLDPAMGSGHFLVVAFDLLAQLYEEERQMEAQGRLPAGWSVPPKQTARVILENNLHGIDIDLRAVQLAALALYLKAKELGWDEAGGPPRLNLVVADAVLSRGEAYEHLLAQYKDDPAIQEAIRVIWHSLEHVRELGSLVRVEEEVEEAIRKIKATEERDIPLISSARDWEAYKQILFQRLKDAFNHENHTIDTGAYIFSTEGQKSIGLLEILSECYDIVCTNPPYLGSGNMDNTLKSYIQEHFVAGCGDLYAAFIIRCSELSKMDGIIALVTQQSWLLNKSFAELRSSKCRCDRFKGILKEIAITVLINLGPGAFREISGEVVNVALFVGHVRTPIEEHKFSSISVMDCKSPSSKADSLKKRAASPEVVRQSFFLSLENATIILGLTNQLLELLSRKSLKNEVVLCEPLTTGDNTRFVHYWWEHINDENWKLMSKGGGYRKWRGLEFFVLFWKDEGKDVKAHPGSYIRNERWMFKSGITFSSMSQPGVSFRLMPNNMTFGKAGPGIFPPKNKLFVYLMCLNTKLYGFLLKKINSGTNISIGNIGKLPICPISDEDKLAELIIFRLKIAETLTSLLIQEYSFKDIGLENIDYVKARQKSYIQGNVASRQFLFVIGACLDAYFEHKVRLLFNLDKKSQDIIDKFTGPCPGSLPIINGYDQIVIPDYERLYFPPELFNYIEQEVPHISLNNQQKTNIKNKIRKFITNGNGLEQGDKESFEDLNNLDIEVVSENRVNLSSQTTIFPSDNYIEELSIKLSINPISIYLLLDEINREEGMFNFFDLQNSIFDYLTVNVLRSLGFRWPMQDQYEKEENIGFLTEKWIKKDGIISLQDNVGDETITALFKKFLDEKFGSENGLEIERGISFALGWKKGDEWGKQKPLPLEKWFEQEFFKRHVSQFKRRPIAWHLTSPKGAFQAFVYYHKFDKDRLKLLRSRYVSETLKELRRQLGEAQNQAALDRKALNRVAELEEKIADVEEFDRRLGLLQEGRQREARIWVPWKSPEEQPVGWDPDINDGVRVNIAPVQRLGLLAAQVLSKKDLDSLLAPEGR